MSLTTWRRLHEARFENQPVLITGGAGFIGSHLAHGLADLGAKVTVLDDLSGGGDPAALPKTAQFVKGSILDEPLLEKVTAGRTFVFHLAALGSVPRSVEQPVLFFQVNERGTLNVLEAARRNLVKRVIFAASSSAYGDAPTLPKSESMPTAPLSPYAANKVAGEAMLSAWSAAYPLDTMSLRFFNIFGPRQNPESAYAAVIAAFAKALFAGNHPTINGDGTQSRDFTYVDNVVHACLLAARSEKRLGGAVANVACGKRITITELAHQMAAAIGRPELTPIYGPDRAGDVKHSLADLTRVKELLGYAPIVDFGAGLNKTMEYYRAILARS